MHHIKRLSRFALLLAFIHLLFLFSMITCAKDPETKQVGRCRILLQRDMKKTYINLMTRKYGSRNGSPAEALVKRSGKRILPIGASKFDQELVKLAANRSQAVNVHFHIICRSQQDNDCPTATQLQAQFDLMVKNYNRPLGIELQLGLVKRYYDPKVFEMQAADENNEKLSHAFTKFMESTRLGGLKDLNIYYKDLTRDGALGMNSFHPQYLNWRNYKSDGVIIDYRTLPQVGANPNRTRYSHIERLYALGKTTIHEVGHWFGLFHPSKGGCDGHDITFGILDDTPPSKPFENLDYLQQKAYLTCNYKQINSCNTKWGHDPTNNFMDYAPDPCMYQFTKGQRSQMHFSFMKFRMRLSMKDLGMPTNDRSDSKLTSKQSSSKPQALKTQKKK